MKWYILLIITILVSGLVYAEGTDSGYVGQQMQLWADIGTTTQFYPSAAANISVYLPNGTVSFLNQAMKQVSMGIYVRNYTPNTSGTFYTYTEYYDNNSVIVATASSTFYIQPARIIGDDNMSGIGIILALGIALAIFSFMAFKFKSDNSRTDTVWKIFSLIMVVLLLVLLAWAGVTSNKQCAFLADNSATGYSYVCQDGESTQGSMFLKLMLLVLTIFFVWIFVSLFISSLEFFRKTGKL